MLSHLSYLPELLHACHCYCREATEESVRTSRQGNQVYWLHCFEQAAHGVMFQSPGNTLAPYRVL